MLLVLSGVYQSSVALKMSKGFNQAPGFKGTSFIVQKVTPDLFCWIIL